MPATLKMQSLWNGPPCGYGPPLLLGTRPSAPTWTGTGLYGIDTAGGVFAFCRHLINGPDGHPASGDYPLFMCRWISVGMEVAA